MKKGLSIANKKVNFPQDMGKLSLNEWLARLERNKRFWEQVSAVRDLPAQEGHYVPYPQWLDMRIREALKSRGIEELYAHQGEALAAIRAGRHLCLCTPTASGKSLCYHIPVLQSILEDEGTRALLSLPTKALAQDQLHEVEQLVALLGVESEPSHMMGIHQTMRGRLFAAVGTL